ncbi:MAG: 50S ribosomal protein L1 [Opitutales bacterium]
MPTKSSKRYEQARLIADPEKEFPLEEAIELLGKMPKAKFDETVEVQAHLGVDPRQSDQMVRGTVSLPNGSGKKVTVLVFTEDAAGATAAGADYAGLDDLVEKVKEGWLDFDVALATPSAMKQVRTVARVLGPRGMMPNPKSGTVTDDIATAIEQVKAGRVEFKMDKTGNVAVVVGKRSFESGKLVENARVAIETLVQAKPDSYKGGRYLRGLAVTSTMCPSVRLDPSAYGKVTTAA